MIYYFYVCTIVDSLTGEALQMSPMLFSYGLAGILIIQITFYGEIALR